MGPKKEKKTKEQIAKAAAGGGKAKEKTNNAVYFDEATYEKLLSDVPKSRLITVSTISDKLRVNGSVARAAIHDLESKGKIKRVSVHRSQLLYTQVDEEEAPAAAAAAE